jgi:hypothetical protein
MTVLSVLALALLLAIFLLGVRCLHKVRAVHLMLFDLRDQEERDGNRHFRQLEALQALYAELQFDKSLPPTRGWAASPDFLIEVARHARDARPSVVVECSSGTSTLVLARALQMNGRGKVFSLEHDPHYAQQTRELLARHGLADWAVVLDAPLEPITFGNAPYHWYRAGVLPALPQIDLLVIDGPPQATGRLARYPAGPVLLPRLAPGGALFLDDAARPDEQEAVLRWRAEFPGLEARSPQCEKGCAVLLRPVADSAVHTVVKAA